MSCGRALAAESETAAREVTVSGELWQFPSEGLAVFCWGTAHKFFEYFIKITCVVKTDSTCNFGDGIM